MWNVGQLAQNQKANTNRKEKKMDLITAMAKVTYKNIMSS
jgi:hypothetical protein